MPRGQSRDERQPGCLGPWETLLICHCSARGELPRAGGPARRTASHGGARVAASLAPCGDAGHVPWEALSPAGEGWACSISVTCPKKEVL